MFWHKLPHRTKSAIRFRSVDFFLSSFQRVLSVSHIRMSINASFIEEIDLTMMSIKAGKARSRFNTVTLFFRLFSKFTEKGYEKRSIYLKTLLCSDCHKFLSAIAPRI